MLRILSIALISLAAAGAAFGESPEDIYQRGYALGQAGKLGEALPLIRTAADGGHAQAQFTLGSMYAFGQGGLAQSREEARAWYERAAAQGHPVALYNLGLYYDNGLGVAQDRARALTYYKRGAAAGDAKAAYNAGELLFRGDGVPADAAQGIAYMEQAARKNTAKAQISLGYIYENGVGVPRDAERALDYYARAEAQGQKTGAERGQFLASTVLSEGLALENDRRGSEALRMFDLACRYGQFYSCYNAGRLRFYGQIVAKDMNGAAASFRAACKWENAPGCRGLANAVIFGADASQNDITITVQSETTSCEKGNAAACHNLAIMKMETRYKIFDRQGAMNLFAQNCFKKNFQLSCQPYMDLYNASLPQSSGSGSSGGGMTWLEQGIIDVLGVVAGTMQAAGAAGRASTGGSYSGYSTYSPPSSTASSGGYSPQDRADFNQFISSVSAYGQSVQCRPGNPYC